MILLKYWREVVLALLVAGLLYAGWHIRAQLDAAHQLKVEVQQQAAQIKAVQGQVAALKHQQAIDNQVSAKAVQTRQATVTERKQADEAFKQDVAKKPQVKTWLNEPLPPDVIDRLRR